MLGGSVYVAFIRMVVSIGGTILLFCLMDEPRVGKKKNYRHLWDLFPCSPAVFLWLVYDGKEKLCAVRANHPFYNDCHNIYLYKQYPHISDNV